MVCSFNTLTSETKKATGFEQVFIGQCKHKLTKRYWRRKCLETICLKGKTITQSLQNGQRQESNKCVKRRVFLKGIPLIYWLLKALYSANWCSYFYTNHKSCFLRYKPDDLIQSSREIWVWFGLSLVLTKDPLRSQVFVSDRWKK